MIDKIIGILLIMIGLALMMYSIDSIARTISDIIYRIKLKIEEKKK